MSTTTQTAETPKILSHDFKTFAYFLAGDVHLFNSTEFTIYEGFWISINGGELTPIEDFGNYVLTVNQFTEADKHCLFEAFN
jgi:hypothetical protein